MRLGGLGNAAGGTGSTGRCYWEDWEHREMLLGGLGGTGSTWRCYWEHWEMLLRGLGALGDATGRDWEPWEMRLGRTGSTWRCCWEGLGALGDAAQSTCGTGSDWELLLGWTGAVWELLLGGSGEAMLGAAGILVLNGSCCWEYWEGGAARSTCDAASNRGVTGSTGKDWELLLGALRGLGGTGEVLLRAPGVLDLTGRDWEHGEGLGRCSSEQPGYWI